MKLGQQVTFQNNGNLSVFIHLNAQTNYEISWVNSSLDTPARLFTLLRFTHVVTYGME